MNGHWKTECRSCGKIVEQCRCPDPAKETRYINCCNACLTAQKQPTAPASPRHAHAQLDASDILKRIEVNVPAPAPQPGRIDVMKELRGVLHTPPQPCPECGSVEKVSEGDPSILECGNCYHAWIPSPPLDPKEVPMTAREFDAEFWTNCDPQDKYTFAEAYAAHFAANAPTAHSEEKVRKLKVIVQRFCDSLQKTHSDSWLSIDSEELRMLCREGRAALAEMEEK